MSEQRISELLECLTLEEKATLCGGKDFWHLHGIDRLELPSIMVTDGPHGLRKQAGEGDHVGLNESVKATCFPTASGLAASWDTTLIEEIGKALGEECRAEDVSVLLGPGVNIKRNPLGGRNFEYFSEDPLLSGQMATAWINGVQSQGVGTSLKHYAVNNHEQSRMTVDAIVDQRTLREIYLPAFEYAVVQAQPWTVMCSYNKINGEYAAEHKQLLDDILRTEWGFEGIVVTDWGANNNRVEGVKNGQNLEMPSSGDMNTRKIIDAVERGELTINQLDKSVGKILELILKSKSTLSKEDRQVDLDAHHELAARIAEETCVLLKNEDLLPVARGKKIAVIGALAESTRYQGAGSSKINPYKLEQPVQEIKKMYGADQVVYTPGYTLNDDEDDSLIRDAILAAEQADVVFLFAGLPSRYESEGFDRTHINLPKVQLDLVDGLSGYLNKTVVVLQNGAPIAMPFVNRMPAILEAYLGGQAGASAIAKVLSGDVNPSGKLAETFPLSIDDVPSQPFFPGTKKQVQYREGIWIGYRYFDTTGDPVLFPFGHGLSYTEFEYSGLNILASSTHVIDNDSTVSVRFTIRNVGERAGAEVVQLYVGQWSPSVPRPVKELKGFDKVFLAPGEHEVVELSLRYRDFAFWSVEQAGWVVEDGEYIIFVGSSSADIRLSQTMKISTGHKGGSSPEALTPYFSPEGRDFNDKAFEALLGYAIPNETPDFPFTMNSTVGDISVTSVGSPIYEEMLEMFAGMAGGEANDSAAEADRLMAESMVFDMPLRNLPVFNANKYSEDRIIDLVEELNSSR